MNRGTPCQISPVEIRFMAILVMGSDGVRPGLHS